MRRRRSKGLTAVTLAVAGFVLAACAGQPDQGFGSGGITLVPPNNQWEKTISLASGKFMAVTRQNFSDEIWRFNANGTLDTTYGQNGVLTTPQCGEFTLAPDGRFFCFNDNANDVVTAYTAAGVPDTGFNNGSITVPFETGSYGSGVSPAGDLYLLFGFSPAIPPPSLTFRRYNTAGQQDSHFVADMGPANNAYVAGFGPGGSIFAVHDISQQNFVLTKFLSTGSPDTSFGTGGSIALPPQMLIDSVAVDNLGGVALLVQESRLHLVLRYTPRGQADRSFGWNGFAALPGLVNTTGPLTLDSQRRVILTATRSNGAGPVQVARYLANGQLDPFFGIHGVETLSKINGDSLLNMHVFQVSTDPSNRPILWLNPSFGAGVGPAITRLDG